MNKLFSQICEYCCVAATWRSLYHNIKARILYRHAVKIPKLYAFSDVENYMRKNKVKRWYYIMKRTGPIIFQEFGRDPQNPSRRGLVVGPSPEPYILFLKKKDAMMFRLKYHE